MSHKRTLRGHLLRTAVLMLVLSILVGILVTLLVLSIFAVHEPEGEVLLTGILHLFLDGEVIGLERLVPYIWLESVLLVLAVAGVCIALTSRFSNRISATLRTLRRGADNLRQGELEFEILTCEDKELDELCQSLESVRQRLKAAAQADAQAQEARGLLMANLSHDLRTPVTAIKGYVEGIQDGIANTPEKQRHYLDTIYQKTLVLEKLVRNMTDFSEYELGRMQYQFVRMELVSFLADVSEEYQQDAERNGLSFALSLPQPPLTVTADRGKLKRVLDNLISNAIKYNRTGGSIRLSAECYGDGVVIQVSDDGQGISEEALHHAFDSFFREDTARSSSVPGSGLGLAICRSIVESHHGKIWLTSQQGAGTRAFVYLPLGEKEVSFP